MFDSFCRKLCTFTSVQRCLNYSIDSSPHSHRFRDVVWIIPSTAVHIHISSDFWFIPSTTLHIHISPMLFELFHRQLSTITSVQRFLIYSINNNCTFTSVQCCLIYSINSSAHSHQFSVVWFIPSTALHIHIISEMFNLFHRQLCTSTSVQRCRPPLRSWTAALWP